LSSAEKADVGVRVREFFGVVPVGQLTVELPLIVELDDGVRAEFTQGDDEALALTIDYPVDPLILTLEHQTGLYQPQQDGPDRELPALRVPENKNIAAIDLTAALTFLTDVPLRVNRPFPPSEILPESEEDSAALDALGTRRVYVEGGVQPSIRTFNAHVDADAIRALIPKTVGLRLYADAVALSADVARYRELWRVMESAFGLQDDKLITALAGYGPAQELGFDEAELRELLILRGQASHAATSSGLEEILRVGEETRCRGDRLKCLAERVILTKRTWGARSGGVDELTPAASWVGARGQIVIRR
jgi:hypothetical protein